MTIKNNIKFGFYQRRQFVYRHLHLTFLKTISLCRLFPFRALTVLKTAIQPDIKQILKRQTVNFIYKGTTTKPTLISNPSVFFIFPTTHFFKAILFHPTFGTFTFAPTTQANTMAKAKEPNFPPAMKWYSKSIRSLIGALSVLLISKNLLKWK